MQQQSLVRACGAGVVTAVAGVLLPRWVPQLAFEPTGQYWLIRVAFLRGLGGVFAVAFAVALFQNKALVGDKGITPARDYLLRVQRYGFGGDWRQAARRVPTLFWLLPREAALDPWLDRTAALGLFLSLVVMMLGAANVPIMLSLWVLYHTLVNVGQHWYGFGWESQLLETAFLAAFAVPFLSLRPFPSGSPPSPLIPWLYRWLGFRVMFGESGAGLIKIKGDAVWKNLTAMDYHYETQPLPNPTSYLLHQTPKMIHRFETAVNHVVELAASWLMLAPMRSLRMIGGGTQALFQLAIIISGNLSFLNYLTILPFIWCFDDTAFAWMFPEVASLGLAASAAAAPLGWSSTAQLAAGWFLVGLVSYLSRPVVRNMAAKKQAMNRTFEPLRLVNTYGAFGSVSKIRPEIIIMGAFQYEDENTAWREYEFRSKPGPLHQRLPWISPYHRRLDWCLWIAALGPRRFSAWFPRLLLKLVENDAEVSKLFKTNPFATSEGPRYIKADLYRYSFTKLGSEESKKGQVWTRELIGSYWRITTREGLLDTISRQAG
ncbi:unnamed protein product [Ascophyllum nodosum]